MGILAAPPPSPRTFAPGPTGVEKLQHSVPELHLRSVLVGTLLLAHQPCWTRGLNDYAAGDLLPDYYYTLVVTCSYSTFNDVEHQPGILEKRLKPIPRWVFASWDASGTLGKET